MKEILNLIESKEWEIKNIIYPQTAGSLRKIENININDDIVIVLRKKNNSRCCQDCWKDCEEEIELCPITLTEAAGLEVCPMDEPDIIFQKLFIDKA